MMRIVFSFFWMILSLQIFWCSNCPKNINVIHYDLDLTSVDIRNFSWNGSVIIRMDIKKYEDTLHINAQKSLKILRVSIDNEQKRFQVNGKVLKIFGPLNNGIHTIKIFFESRPPKSFLAPWDGGYALDVLPDSSLHVGVACQEEGASIWFPCIDSWSDKADSGMSLTIKNIPRSYMAVSNGRKISKHHEESAGTWKWKAVNPIHPYNINITIGKFSHLTDTLFSKQSGRVLTLDYFILKKDSLKALKHFSMVKPMLRCLEEKLGPYPFYEDGYKLVQTPYLGMEHQSCVAYGNNFMNGYKGDLNMTGGLAFDFIILHETIHEWFGNSVTACDISEMWIHEAFTTWAESWYAACLAGNKYQENYIYKMRYRIVNDAPMKGDSFNQKPGSSDMYAKGAQVIQGIKYILKNPSWFDSLAFELCVQFKKSNISAKQLYDWFQPQCRASVKDYFESYMNQQNPPALLLTKKKTDVYEMHWTGVTKRFAFPVYISQNEFVDLKQGEKKIIQIRKWDVFKDIQKGYFRIEIKS
jgi:aminopeptidase N